MYVCVCACVGVCVCVCARARMCWCVCVCMCWCVKLNNLKFSFRHVYFPSYELFNWIPRNNVHNLFFEMAQ